MTKKSGEENPTEDTNSNKNEESTTEKDKVNDDSVLLLEDEEQQIKHKSLSSSLGVHIPQTISNTRKLPSADLWTVDVYDHILFENLPDSTGTWDQMKDIMSKVKSKMKKIHSD